MKKRCQLRRKLNEIARISRYYRFLILDSGREVADRWLAMRTGKNVEYEVYMCITS